MSQDTKMANTIEQNCESNCISQCNPAQEAGWVKFADSFLVLAFAVGIYSQVFAFFLYAFATNT